jgi:hypothetical protein
MKLVIRGSIELRYPQSSSGSMIFPPIISSPSTSPFYVGTGKSNLPLQVTSIEIIKDNESTPDDAIISVPLNEFSTSFLDEISKYTTDSKILKNIKKVKKFIELLDLSSTIGRGNSNGD